MGINASSSIGLSVPKSMMDIPKSHKSTETPQTTPNPIIFFSVDNSDSSDTTKRSLAGDNTTL